MLETHQRAAWLTNEPNVAWHHFLRSRFVGRLPARDGGAGFAVIVQAIEQQSAAHAELRGCVEYFSDPSLPVVFEFMGILQIETREFSIQKAQPNQPRNYSGQFSENGRVLTLRARDAAHRDGNPFHLIHEETLAALSED
jgi:hypothetical protein